MHDGGRVDSQTRQADRATSEDAGVRDAPAADRVFDPAHRALAIGLLLTITLVGFEALGVATAMPVVARSLHGLSLYGWVFAAATLASLVGTAVAGQQVDRLGPARPFAAGLALFGIGLLIGASAPTMTVLVGGRFVQGLGAGVIAPVVYAVIGRTFGPHGQARMFALLSSAWVLPGLIGPSISAAIVQHLGWRWVFFGIVPLIPLTAALSLPALRHLVAVPRDGDAGTPGLTARAVRLAAGTGLVLAGLGFRSLLAAPFVIVGIALALPALRGLLPPGALVGRAGLPAAVATRGLQTFAFFGAEAFVPLAITAVRGRSPIAGGLVLTTGALSWTAGAWIQERTWRRIGRRACAVVGLACITASVASVALVLVPWVPVAAAAGAWFIGGFGMGISYSSLSLTVLAEAAARARKARPQPPSRSPMCSASRSARASAGRRWRPRRHRPAGRNSASSPRSAFRSSPRRSAC